MLLFYLKLNIIFFIGGSIGDCTIDSFSVSAPGNKGSPEICGLNTGQHSKNYLHKQSNFCLNVGNQNESENNVYQSNLAGVKYINVFFFGVHQ